MEGTYITPNATTYWSKSPFKDPPDLPHSTLILPVAKNLLILITAFPYLGSELPRSLH